MPVKAKTWQRVALAAVTGVAVATTAGCGSDNGASASAAAGSADCPTGALSGGGSTFQLNIEQQWAADFAQECSGSQVNYSGIGSGAGIQQFGSGTIDFAGSDVPMIDTEQSAADKRCDGKAITFPVTAGGIAVIYNLNDVSDLRLSASTLAGIFQGTIKRWNDPAIVKDNPDAKLPAVPVVTYHRADGSGTTAVFSAFEKVAAGKDWTLGADKELNWPGGQGATGSDGVVQGVKSTNGGITYAEVSYASANNLPTASISTGAGDFVDLTPDAVSQAIDTGFTSTAQKPDVTGTIDVESLTGYPLSTVSYAIVCQHYSDSKTGQRVKAFLDYALGTGQSSATDLGYAPLPTAMVTKARAALDSVS